MKEQFTCANSPRIYVQSPLLAASFAQVNVFLALWGR